MKRFFEVKNFGAMLLLCLFFCQSKAQQKFIKTTAELAEIKKLKAKVEANPSDLKAHEAYIWAYNPDNPALADQYRILVRQFPANYVVPFAIGKALENRENPKATEFLLQASALKPDNAAIWTSLAGTTYLTNDVIKRKLYLQKAAQLEPKNPEYAFNYAYSFKDTDPEKYDSLSLEVARKFPNSEKAAQALYWLDANTTIPSKKIAYFKLIKNNLTNHNSEWYLSAMKEYFDFLLKTSIEQAYELGLQMRVQDKLFPELWHERLTVANAFLEAKELMNNNHPEQALKLLNQVKLNNTMMANRHIDAKEYLTIFKAEAAGAANQTKTAFDTVANLYSKTPSEILQASLYKYGTKLGMDSTQIIKNIADKRSIAAKIATPFSLQNYTSNEKTSLADYKGKVVLLTYWFPGCGPCRAEFPYFESVLKKFNRNDIAYLGLNVEPMQDEAVLPLLKESGYTFTALHDDRIRNKGNLPTDGQPTNYLIDQQGRLIFSNFRIDESNEKTLELMIKELLAVKG